MLLWWWQDAFLQGAITHYCIVMNGSNSGRNSFRIEVGTGSKEQDFVGEDSMIFWISSALYSSKLLNVEVAAGNLVLALDPPVDFRMDSIFSMTSSEHGWWQIWGRNVERNILERNKGKTIKKYGNSYWRNMGNMGRNIREKYGEIRWRKMKKKYGGIREKYERKYVGNGKIR